MIKICKESWDDITHAAERAVYSDMRASLTVDYRKLQCLQAALLAFEADDLDSSDVMKNARTSLLQDIAKALDEIDGEAVRFKTILNSAVVTNAQSTPRNWVPSAERHFDLDDPDVVSHVFDLSQFDGVNEAK